MATVERPGRRSAASSVDRRVERVRGRHLVGATPQVDAVQPYVLVDPELVLEGGDRRLAAPSNDGQVVLGETGRTGPVSAMRDRLLPSASPTADQRLDAGRRDRAVAGDSSCSWAYASPATIQSKGLASRTAGQRGEPEPLGREPAQVVDVGGQRQRGDLGQQMPSSVKVRASGPACRTSLAWSLPQLKNSFSAARKSARLEVLAGPLAEAEEAVDRLDQVAAVGGLEEGVHVGGQPLQFGVQVVERDLQLVDVALDLAEVEVHLGQPVEQAEVHRVQPLLDPVEADPHLVAQVDDLLADLLELFEDHLGRRLGLADQTGER